MKNIFLSTVISSALIFGVTGCGNDKDKSISTLKVQKEVQKVSSSDRKNILENKIKSYAEYGFDINKTSSKNYIFTLKEPKKVIETLLGVFNLNFSLDNQDREELIKLLQDTKFNVNVDWDKYASNQPHSIEVALLGKKDNHKSIDKFLKDKKLGAYLTYDMQDKLTKIDFKDIEDKLFNADSNKTAYINLKNTFIDVKSTTVYDFKSQKFEFKIADEFNSSVEIGYKDAECNVDKKSLLFGSQKCQIPNVYFVISEDGIGANKINLNGITTLYSLIKKNSKVSEDAEFGIKSIDFKDTDIKDIKVSINLENIDANIMKQYEDMITNISDDYKSDMKKVLLLAGKIYQNGVVLKYNASMNSFKLLSDGVNFEIDGYNGHGETTFDNNITHSDKSIINNIIVSDSTNAKNAFVLRNFEFNYGIRDLYNFMPEVLESISEIQFEDNATKAQMAFNDSVIGIAEDIVHNGLNVYIDALGFDNMTFSDAGARYSLDKTHFDLDVKLQKNDLKLDANNPMTSMMLLSYLKADGKFVVPAKDLQTLAQKPELAMLGMLMMMAKLEGDNAVFIIKFENGKLLVNGQPMM